MLFKKVNTLTAILYILLSLGKYLSAPVENKTFSILNQNISNDIDVNDYSRDTIKLTDEDMMDDEDSTMDGEDSIDPESKISPGKSEYNKASAQAPNNVIW